MSLTDDQLDSFSSLATAIGLMEGGSPRTSWFEDPVGKVQAGVVTPGLSTMLADDTQRDALVEFVDEVLGDPDRDERGDEVWVPLFDESEPDVTIYVVLTERTGAVWVGVGMTYGAGSGTPRVTTTLHVPIFQMKRAGGSLDAGDPSTPEWLLLGSQHGNITLSVDAVLDETLAPPGDASLGGVSLDVEIPTASTGQVSFAVGLDRLQLPGATAPQDFTLDVDSIDELGTDVLELVVGLLRAQADALDLTDATVAPFAALTGMLGIRSVSGIPPFPIADVVSDGASTIVDWVGEVLDDGTARDAWLGELAALVGASVDTARDAISFSIGPADLLVGIRIDGAVSGQPVLTPWIELALDTGSPTRARVQVAADLFRLDTATGEIRALPDLRAEAVFGVEAGGPALLVGDPGVESLRLGVALRDGSQPEMRFVLGNVTVTGTTHPTVDLSSPEAALDAASTLVDAALAAALAGLGPAGSAVAVLIGLQPPAGVSGTDAVQMLADPLGELADYWDDLTGNPAAMSSVLREVANLVIGGSAPAVPGAGSVADPWSVALAGPVALSVWVDGGTLAVDLVVSATQPVFADHQVVGAVRVHLLRARLGDRSLDLLTGVQGGLRLERDDAADLELAMADVAVRADHVAVDVMWRAASGIRVALEAPNLVVQGPAPSLGSAGAVSPGPHTEIPLALPSFDAGGNLVFAPDWRAVEDALALLLGRLGSGFVDALLELVGWSGAGDARLGLGALIADPEVEVRRWAADVVLDCARVRDVLGPLSALLNGLRGHALYGQGTATDPYRCNVGGAEGAPGLAVWTEPGCPPYVPANRFDIGRVWSPDPIEMGEVVAVLEQAGDVVESIDELLVARDGLAAGLDLLRQRWVGSDGLVVPPASMPAGVTSVVVEGASYLDLVAMGMSGEVLFEALDPVPTAVVHVGSEIGWLAERAAGTAFDASGTATATTIPATGDDEWFIQLPDRPTAEDVRSDRDATTEQAARLADVLADRTAPVTVLAYGDTGAAALRVAATVTAVAHVVTVGVPWGAISTGSLATGLGGDALRMLDLLRVRGDDAVAAALGDDDVGMLDEMPEGRQMAAIVERAVRLLDASRQPVSATTETIRSGLEVTAVFGALDSDGVEFGVAELIGEAIEARIAADTAVPIAPVTSVHAGVSIPPLDVDVGGIQLGANITLEAAKVERDAAGGISADLSRQVIVDLRFGVTDGWLVGGPGASQHDLEVRRLSARVVVPLDARPASTTLTLHEATTYGVFREKWVIGPGDDPTATVVPEARALIAQVVTRIRTAATDVADLFEALGLIRDGGLDPDALDRWIYDTRDAVDDALAAGTSTLAAAIRTVLGDTVSTGSSIGWAAGPTQLSVDLSTGDMTGSVALSGGDGASVDISLDVSRTAASAVVAIGTGDATRGGVSLAAAASTATGAALAVRITSPGGAIEALPLVGPAAATALGTAIATGEAVLDSAATVARLISAGAGLVVAGLSGRLIDYLRATVTTGAATLDDALDLLGLLGPADDVGVQPAIVPFGLVSDPAGWFTSALTSWQSDFAGSAVSLLDAVGGVVVGGGSGRWDLSSEFSVRYSKVGDRLELLADYTDEQTIGTSSIGTAVGAGVSVGLGSSPLPAVEAAVTVNGSGLRLRVDPDVQLDLVRAAPATPLTLYPGPGSIGELVSGVGGMVAPLILNELIEHADDTTPGLTRDVAVLVRDVGVALDLTETAGTDPAFTEAKITAFAANPAGVLLARLPQLAASGLSTLADALDPGGSVVAVATPAVPNQITFRFGNADGASITIDTSAASPVIELGCDVTIPGVGPIVVEYVRLSATGVQVSARFGPAEIDLGPIVMRPLVVVRAGTPATGFEPVLGVGLASDSTGAASLEFRWGLDATPPELVVVTRAGSVESLGTDPAEAALQLLGWAVSLAGGILVEELDGLLTTEVKGWLQGVVFTDVSGSAEIDATLFTDLLEPEDLLDRLLRLAWNVATVSPPSLDIDGKVTIGVVAAGTPSDKTLGLNLTLSQDFPIATGDTEVDLVVDAAWISPQKAAGLTINLLRGSVTSLVLEPSVIAAGIGVKVSKNAGPLLDLGGVAIDAISVHTYGEATSTGQLGGGIELQLDGFAFSPAAGGGDNAVANSIMNDAGEAGAANRPSFDPAISVQAHPGDTAPRIGLRAGDPPGPWWLRVQRQLGPLYLEQVGLDTVEANGKVTRISLLFDGSITLFGLTAAVEQLSLNWNGGDVLSIDSWSVDLMGLAVSADLSGVYLSGGMLKTVDGSTVSYVGMLMGRFGVYGLSVFGGYTDDNGSPSFFVFGALNGPIGGPPAFFLTGIGGGLGINRGLVVPDDLSEFDQYPFIKALDPAASPSDSPMEELRQLAEYFPPESGQFWFAAGISFTSFAIVDGVAVVAVSFGDGLDINLFGLARLALPRPQVALVSIELGILARFSTSEGLFIIQAQLTDNSWLLYPEVRLTGGFAMATWWKGALAGQFVLTMGGYNPNFHRDGYPQVPRLGLEWRISNAIVIKGASYFALTSEALMAGVDVEVSADWGWAWVRVAFGAHAIVFFDPFYFIASAYARISAGIEIDVWIGTISISISLGARIEVEGPKFSGTATFEIGPCDISVSFGDKQKEKTPAISWSEFVPKYLEDAGGGAARAISSVTGRGTLPASTDGDTSAPSSDGSSARPFEVFAEFEIVFVTTVPVTTFEVGGQAQSVTPTTAANTPVDLGVAPMEVDDLTATLKISLQQKLGGTWTNVSTTKLDKLAAGLGAQSSDVATSHFRTDAFPLGVWGEAEDEDDKPLPKGDIVRAGNIIKLVAGYDSATAGPQIDYRQVTAGRRPLPLSASGGERSSILVIAGAIALPNPLTATQALEFAYDAVFAEGAGVATQGTLARGDHSETAKRSFTNDRVAPPRFGTLTDGLAVVNGDRASVETLSKPAGPTPRVPREPVVIGHLAGGAGVVDRAGHTTVADALIKRRAAPTVDSVRGRLGDELALVLERASTPGIEYEGTVVAKATPRTDLAGAAISNVGGRLSAPHLSDLVGGLSRSPRGLGAEAHAAAAADGPPSPIRSGDVVVLDQRDAKIDVGDARPSLHVGGAARVVMVRNSGRVVVDRSASDENVVVPRGVRFVAVQADGMVAGVIDGQAQLAGWHGRSRLARIGGRTALGAGCVVRSDRTASRRRTGWVDGREMVSGATRVTTRFTDTADFLVLVLDGTAPVSLDPLAIALDGCRRTTDESGTERPPTVVLAGSQSLVFLPVETDVNRPEFGTGVDQVDAPIRVTVTSGGDWRLGGVLIGRGEIAPVAEVAAAQGVDALAARLLATKGAGSSIEWKRSTATRTRREE